MNTSYLKPFVLGQRERPGPPLWRVWGPSFWLAVALSLGPSTRSLAADPSHTPAAAAVNPATPASAAKPVVDKADAAAAKNVADQVRNAIGSGNLVKKNRDATIVTSKDNSGAGAPGKEANAPAQASHKVADKPQVGTPAAVKKRSSSGVDPQEDRQFIRAKTAALTGHGSPASSDAHHGGPVHWSYQGENGPQAWGRLQSDFNTCAVGKRQSPIDIEESSTLQGPAEPLQFNYQASSGTVINNGHTIQVDLDGDNTLTVRNSTYKLLQFHFHTPSEERINHQAYAMVAHLVHKNPEGQLAVVAVLLDPGVANAVVNKVWTHMPLDTDDRVRMPASLVDMNELLPKDQRYYQFMGSLTTPPCTEGVLWMVFKQPTTVSQGQIKLFSQLFPHNARPVQPLNGRVVRDAQ